MTATEPTAADQPAHHETPAAILRAAAAELDQYVGIQSSDAAPEVEGARLVIRELRRIADRSQPPAEPGTCGHRSPDLLPCNRKPGHYGYHRYVRLDGDVWTSWVGELDLPAAATPQPAERAPEPDTDRRSA